MMCVCVCACVCVDTTAATDVDDATASTAVTVDATVAAHVVTAAYVAAAAAATLLAFTHACVCTLKVRRISSPPKAENFSGSINIPLSRTASFSPSLSPSPLASVPPSKSKRRLRANKPQMARVGSRI